MYRCAFALAAAVMVAAPASAQTRNFPQNALRGELIIGTPPEARLNDRDVRLSPGARIRNAKNLFVLTNSVAGAELVVNYTLDLSGNIRDVWILTAEEARRQPWPTTPEQAQQWQFDPVAQTWSKR